ncbi:hypothetical protein [Piscinibacter sp. XHJ-5]|uniref:hypothetical protein n=1 Tax=Piscinibacter sp. XHJ-5 TaxID=3037797 RepID=UPI0024533E0B|nr:hypothetical protein [Piscinibacter sp. XHJ-5]
MKTTALSLARWFCAALLGASLATAGVASPPADAMRARHASLAAQLASNPFQRPVHLQSVERSDDVTGEVFAVVDHPFATLDASLKGAERWCEVLILPFNVKRCRASTAASTQQLVLYVGRKYDQPVEKAFQVNFEYRLSASEPDYLKVQLNADEGPLGTHDYRIVFEAAPLDDKRSLLHMSYSYGFGLTARLAMQGYLSTVGRDKVGFTVVGMQADGQPAYVGRMRGVIERNTMRYYLAIDAYLDSLSAPPSQRVEQRLRNWFTATERYPRQLHEIEEAEYLAMKRKEIGAQLAKAS